MYNWPPRGVVAPPSLLSRIWGVVVALTSILVFAVMLAIGAQSICSDIEDAHDEKYIRIYNAGKRASEGGVPSSGNPHSGDKGEVWLQGWVDGRKKP